MAFSVLFAEVFSTQFPLVGDARKICWMAKFKMLAPAVHQKLRNHAATEKISSVSRLMHIHSNIHACIDKHTGCTA